MNKLTIYHYSSRDFKGKIDPKYFGLNSYTRESVKEAEIDRAFFYVGRGREIFLSGAKFCYIAEIEPGKIYDLEKDPKNFKEKFTFNEILTKIKNLGFYGISGNNGFKVICLFKVIKYIDKRRI